MRMLSFIQLTRDRLILLILLCINLFAIILHAYISWRSNPEPYGWDFPSYYYGAGLILSNISPYWSSNTTLDTLKVFQWHYPFLSPPNSIFAFLPFVYFDIQTASWILRICSILSVLVTLFVLVIRYSKNQFLISIVALLVMRFYGVLETLGANQFNLIVLMLLVVSCTSFKNDKYLISKSFCIAIAVMLKPIAVLGLVLLITIKQARKFLIHAALIYVVFVVLSLFFIDPKIYSDWINLVLLKFADFKIAKQLPNMDIYHIGIKGICHSIYKSGLISYFHYSILWFIASSLAFVIAVWSCHKLAKNQDNHDQIFAIATFIIPLCAPVGWDHYLIFCIPTIIFIASRMLSETSIIKALSCAAIIILYLLPIRTIFNYIDTTRLVFNYCTFYGLIGLVVYYFLTCILCPTNKDL